MTPGHMQCMCDLGCLRVSSTALQGQACTCCIQVSGNGCAVRSERKKPLRAERKALKALLTPVSSADHHLVPVLAVLPSYRTALDPCLSESSKRCWFTDFNLVQTL